MAKGLAGMLALEGIAEALNEAKAQQDALPKSVQAKRLAAMFRTYQTNREQCPFRPGDLVTPVDNVNYKGHGDPHIVLEVRDCPEPLFYVGDANSSGFGHRLDIRVACMNGETLVTYWMESWVLEKWEGHIAA